MSPKCNDWRKFTPEVNPKKIGIIGGKGSMGALLAKEFKKDGYAVQISDKNGAPTEATERSLCNLNLNIAKNSDVVIFSLPIDVFRKGINHTLGTGNQRGFRKKLFLDVSSVKESPLEELSKFKGPAIIGTHPMFGPKVTNFDGQNVAICPIRSRTKKWINWVEEFWKSRGANTIRFDPKEHDMTTPSVQFSVLMAVMLYGDTITETNVDLSKAGKIATPNSRLLSALVGRMLNTKSSPMYANLITENPYNLKFAKQFKKASQRIYALIKSQNTQGILEELQKISQRLPENYKNEGLKLSSFIQEAIAERKFFEEILKNRSAVEELLASEKTNRKPQKK